MLYLNHFQSHIFTVHSGLKTFGFQNIFVSHEPLKISSMNICKGKAKVCWSGATIGGLIRFKGGVVSKPPKFGYFIVVNKSLLPLLSGLDL